MHQCEGVTVWIIEKRHPEVVIFHWRNQMGLARESDPALLKFADSKSDIGAAEVDCCADGNAIWLRGLFEEQPYTGAIKERQISKSV